MPRQVIFVITGMSGNLRAQLFSGMERRRGEGHGASQDIVLCRCKRDAFILGQVLKGSSVLLQIGELSVKHPKNSQVPSFSDK